MQAKVFHKLVGLDEAIGVVLETLKPKPKGVEDVSLLSALYRVLAEDVYAPVDYPPFDRSEVDGYAVQSASVARATETSPVKLRVLGSVSTGSSGEGLYCDESSAISVATGAIIPAGCDAVVMEEYTERVGDEVKVYRQVAPGENISTAGSDISAGSLVLPRGTLLKHKQIAILAGLGVSRVRVYERPRVVVYSTGNEVYEPGKPLPYGKVYDVNGYLISTFLAELGAEVHYGGILPDDYDVIRESIEKNLRNYDVVVTSGGTSAGVSDVVYRVFEALGEVLVHGLKVKPGKPTVIAHARGKLLIGLPGFPLSSYMILVRVVKPIIAALTGYRYYEKPLQVKLPTKIRKPVGITWLIPSILVKSGEVYVAYPISLSSGSIQAITYSEGFIEVSEGIEVLSEGESTSYYPLVELPEADKLVIIGSNDPLFEEFLKETGLIYASKILNTGSTGGWLAIKRGEADIAPTHLLDPSTGKYNTPFLKAYGLAEKAVVIRGYDRLIGFIVAKGNPKKIAGFEDFFRSDVRIVNRTRGSGIRTLIDYNLARIAEKAGISPREIPKLVKGYTYEVKTHTAVALAVKTGKADVGIAVGYVAEMYGLDFIPVGWEEFDFLVLKSRLSKPLVRDFVEFLRKFRLPEGASYTQYYRFPSNIGYVKED